MSDIGKVKPTFQTIPIRPISKETPKNERGKKEEGKDLPEENEDNPDDHIDEII